MLVQLERVTRDTVAVEIKLPYYAKDKQFDWWYMITENKVIEVLPWSIREECRDRFLTTYETLIQKALTDMEQTTKEEFNKAFKTSMLKLVRVVCPEKEVQL